MPALRRAALISSAASEVTSLSYTQMSIGEARNLKAAAQDRDYVMCGLGRCLGLSNEWRRIIERRYRAPSRHGDAFSPRSSVAQIGSSARLLGRRRRDVRLGATTSGDVHRASRIEAQASVRAATNDVTVMVVLAVIFPAAFTADLVHTSFRQGEVSATGSCERSFRGRREHVSLSRVVLEPCRSRCDELLIGLVRVIIRTTNNARHPPRLPEVVGDSQHRAAEMPSGPPVPSTAVGPRKVVTLKPMAHLVRCFGKALDVDRDSVRPIDVNPCAFGANTIVAVKEELAPTTFGHLAVEVESECVAHSPVKDEVA